MSTMRFDTRAGRARRATARIDLRLPIFVVAALAVFACCFALGRTRGVSGAPGEPGPSLPTSFQSAAAPLSLSGAGPIELPVAMRAHRHMSGKSESVLVRSARALAQEGARAPLDTSQPARSVSSPSVEAPGAPAEAAPPSGPGSSGGTGGNSKPASSGGGSFDSSG